MMIYVIIMLNCIRKFTELWARDKRL